MGWASAGMTIFDPVMKALRDANVDREVKKIVAVRLIAALQNEDWDTEDESLEAFSDDPAIVEAFAQRAVYLPGTPGYYAKYGVPK